MLRTTAQRKDLDAPRAWDAADGAFKANPYPRYAELRDDDVLHRNDELWVLTRYADVQAVLRDQRMSSHPRHIPEEVIAARVEQFGGARVEGPLLLAGQGIRVVQTARAQG